MMATTGDLPITMLEDEHGVLCGGEARNVLHRCERCIHRGKLCDGACGSAEGYKPGNCLPEGVMFDAFGAPRARYVRVSLGGTHCVMRPREGDTYLDDARSSGDDSAYVLSDVWLSEREFEALGEFDGF